MSLTRVRVGDFYISETPMAGLVIVCVWAASAAVSRDVRGKDHIYHDAPRVLSSLFGCVCLLYEALVPCVEVGLDTVIHFNSSIKKDFVCICVRRGPMGLSSLTCSPKHAGAGSYTLSATKSDVLKTTQNSHQVRRLKKRLLRSHCGVLQG